MIISPSMAEKTHFASIPISRNDMPVCCWGTPCHPLSTLCSPKVAITKQPYHNFQLAISPIQQKNIRNHEIPNNPHFNVGCSQHFEARSLIPWGEDSAPPLPRRADAAVPAPNGPPATPRRGPSAWGSTGRGRKGLPGRCQRSHAAPVGPYQKQIQAWKIWQDLIWELNMCVFLVMWKALKEEVLDRCQIFLKT